MSRSTPTFSVVVPTYNRPAQLAECLEALAALAFPRERFEVVVADDGGESSLEPVIAPFRDRMRVRVIRQNNAGPAAARNAGAAAATGRFLAFTDDDCRPRPDWLDRLHDALSKNDAAMIGGRSVNALPNNACSTASQVILDVVYDHFNSGAGGPRFFASNNVAMPRTRFNELGGFDADFPLAAGEDRDLCDRWRHRGLPLLYAEDAVVDHAHPLTLKRFYRQHFNYGRGAYLYHQLRARRQSGRMRDDVGLHFRLPTLLREPLSRLRLTMAIRVLVLLGVWQVANAHGFFLERWRSRRRERKAERQSDPVTSS